MGIEPDSSQERSVRNKTPLNQFKCLCNIDMVVCFCLLTRYMSVHIYIYACMCVRSCVFLCMGLCICVCFTLGVCSNALFLSGILNIVTQQGYLIYIRSTLIRRCVSPAKLYFCSWHTITIFSLLASCFFIMKTLMTVLA